MTAPEIQDEEITVNGGATVYRISTSTIGSSSDGPVRDSTKALSQNVEFSPLPHEIKVTKVHEPDAQSSPAPPAPPIQDLSERMLTLYLQHLWNSVYLMLIIALGFVYPLINALSYDTDKYEKSKEQFEIFMILIHGVSIVVLSIVLIRLTMHKSDEDRGHGEGLNFFLRIGAIVFCIGVIILNILRALEPVELLVMKKCSTPVKPTHILYYSLSVIFYALQTYFMFKYHKTSFLSGPSRQEKHYIVQLWVIRYALIHLIGVNLIHWLNSIMWEAVELFQEANLQFNNMTPHYQSLNASCGPSAVTKRSAKQAQPYLFPCVIEYSLIAASALLGMYMRVGQVEEERILKKLVPTGPSMVLSVSSEIENDQDLDNFTIQTQTMNTLNEVFGSSLSKELENGGVSLRVPSRMEADAISTVTARTAAINRAMGGAQPVCKHPRICEKAHVGFFVGLMLLAGSIVYIACEFIFKKKIKELDPLHITFNSIWIAHYVLGFCLSLYLIIRLTNSFRYDFRLSVEMEKLLLYVTYFVNLIFLIACTVADVANAREAKYYTPIIRGLNIFGNIAQIFQETFQAVYIFYGLNLRAISRSQRKNKPGRTVLTVFIFLNMIVWLRESLLLKSFIITYQYIYFYGLLPWCMIASACFPLIIFFRFHSASLLAEIWSRAYD